MAFKEKDRIRFIDSEKNKEFGVLVILSIKHETITVASLNYEDLGKKPMNVKENEIQLAE